MYDTEEFTFPERLRVLLRHRPPTLDQLLGDQIVAPLLEPYPVVRIILRGIKELGLYGSVMEAKSHADLERLRQQVEAQGRFLPGEAQYLFDCLAYAKGFVAFAPAECPADELPGNMASEPQGDYGHVSACWDASWSEERRRHVLSRRVEIDHEGGRRLGVTCRNVCVIALGDRDFSLSGEIVSEQPDGSAQLYAAVYGADGTVLHVGEVGTLHAGERGVKPWSAHMRVAPADVQRISLLWYE